LVRFLSNRFLTKFTSNRWWALGWGATKIKQERPPTLFIDERKRQSLVKVASPGKERCIKTEKNPLTLPSICAAPQGGRKNQTMSAGTRTGPEKGRDLRPSGGARQLTGRKSGQKVKKKCGKDSSV